MGRMPETVTKRFSSGGLTKTEVELLYMGELDFVDQVKLFWIVIKS
jgi:hypothetical protein